MFTWNNFGRFTSLLSILINHPRCHKTEKTYTITYLNIDLVRLLRQQTFLDIITIFCMYFLYINIDNLKYDRILGCCTLVYSIGKNTLIKDSINNKLYFYFYAPIINVLAYIYYTRQTITLHLPPFIITPEPLISSTSF